MSLTTATATPYVLRSGGKEYLLSRLRIGDWGEYEAALKKKVVDLARDSMAGCDSPEDKRLLLEMAFERAGRISLSFMDEISDRMKWVATEIAGGRDKDDIRAEEVVQGMSPEAREVFSLNASPDMLTTLTLLSLRRKHPAITREEVANLLDEEDVNPFEVQAWIWASSNERMPSSQDNGETKSPKGAAAPEA